MKTILGFIVIVAVVAYSVYRKQANGEEAPSLLSFREVSEPTNSASHTFYAVVCSVPEGEAADKDQISNAVSEIFELDLAEAETIAKCQSAIVSIYDSKANADDYAASLNDWEVNAHVVTFTCDADLDTHSIFHIDNSFNLPGRGAVATGVNYRKSLKTGTAVVIVKKDGSTLASTITGLEVFRKMLDEALPGQNCGMGLSGIASNQFEKGDAIIPVR